MQGLIVKTLVGSGLLALGLTASAQYRGDYGYRGDAPYNNNGYERYDYRYGREPLDRVRADLDRAAAGMGYLSRGELGRFNHARDEIREFQEKWNRGRFDRGELNDVISSLQRVVDSNRLRYEDRDILYNDLARLREIRDRSNGYRNGYDRDRYDRYRDR